MTKQAAKKKMGKKKDKYDRVIEFLLKQEDFLSEVVRAWSYPSLTKKEHPAHCLFQALTSSGRSKISSDGFNISCLTLIRAGYDVAPTIKLTKQIQKDSRFPSSVRDITPESLHIFAEYQREFDKTIRKKRTK